MVLLWYWRWIFNCWSVILQIFEFQKCPFQGDCPQRGERLTMRTGKSWTHCVYCHNAWAFYWLLLSLYLSGLRWLEVPSHTQLASFIKLLVDLSLKFNIWRKTSGVGVVGEYLGWWDHFRPMTDRWFLWRQVQVQFLCGLLLLERTHNSSNETALGIVIGLIRMSLTLWSFTVVHQGQPGWYGGDGSERGCRHMENTELGQEHFKKLWNNLSALLPKILCFLSANGYWPAEAGCHKGAVLQSLWGKYARWVEDYDQWWGTWLVSVAYLKLCYINIWQDQAKRKITRTNWQQSYSVLGSTRNSYWSVNTYLHQPCN